MMPEPKTFEGPDGRYSLRKLDRYLLGDLTPAEKDLLEHDLARDPALAAQLQRMQNRTLGVPLARFMARAKRGVSASSPPQRIKPVRPRFDSGGRGVWALASVLVLVAGSSYLAFWNDPGGAPLRAKGASETAVRLHFQGRDYDPGTAISAEAGDTLVIHYRSRKPVYAQGWLRLTDASFVPASSSRDSAVAWPATPSWREASTKLVSTGTLAGEEIWIMLSSRPFDTGAASRFLRQSGPGGNFSAHVFPLAPRSGTPEK